MTIREEAFAGMPVSCRVIDVHTHLCPYHMEGWHQKYDRTGTAEILEDMKRLGINAIVTAPHPMIQERMEEANRIAKEAAERFPGIVYGHISIVPACGMDAVKEEIRKYGNDPAFVGFKFLTGYHGDIRQPEYEYALDFAEETACPVLCHEWNNSPDRRGFAEVLEKRHRLKLIVAHQGGGSAADTDAYLPVIRSYENAYMELCGSLFNRYPVEQLAEMAGADRLIFGTDSINLDTKYEFGRVAFSLLDDEDKKKVFAGNFLRILAGSSMGKIPG